MEKLLTVNAEEWRAEVPSIREHFANFGDKLPAQLRAEVDKLEQQLWLNVAGLTAVSPAPEGPAGAHVGDGADGGHHRHDQVPARHGQGQHHGHERARHPHQLESGLEPGEGPPWLDSPDVALDQGVEGRLGHGAGHARRPWPPPPRTSGR